MDALTLNDISEFNQITTSKQEAKKPYLENQKSPSACIRGKIFDDARTTKNVYTKSRIAPTIEAFIKNKTSQEIDKLSSIPVNSIYDQSTLSRIKVSVNGEGIFNILSNKLSGTYLKNAEVNTLAFEAISSSLQSYFQYCKKNIQSSNSKKIDADDRILIGAISTRLGNVKPEDRDYIANELLNTLKTKLINNKVVYKDFYVTSYNNFLVFSIINKETQVLQAASI